MTYSIGFRAPSRGELIEGFAAQRADGLAQDDRYGDPDLARQAHPGEIAPAALDRLHTMVLSALADRDAFARWFGEQASAPRYPDADWRPDRPVRARAVEARLRSGRGLLRNPASRFAFVRRGDADCLLFVDGQSWECPAALAETLCSAAPDPARIALAGGVALLVDLINRGAVAFDEG